MTTGLWRGIIVASGVLWMASCRGCDPEVQPTVCDFSVTPSGEGNEIVFNDTQVGRSATRTWRVSNNGTGVTLSALRTTFETVNAEHYDADIPEGARITVGDSATFTVEFHPLAEAEIASRFTVSHPDVGNARCPTATVFVRGRGFRPQEVDAGPEDAGPEDGGFFIDGGVVDAGTVDPPDGGVFIGPDSEWFAYGALEEPRARFAAIQLDDGTDDIIVIGGYTENAIPTDSIERIDVRTGISRIVARMAVPRAEPAAAQLPNGRIVIVGGRSAAVGGFALRTSEIFDPQTDAVTCLDPSGCGLDNQGSGALPVGRIGAIASAVGAGEVMVLLGRTLDANGNEVLRDGGEVLSLAPTLTSSAVGNAGILFGRNGPAHVIDDDGSVLLIGGRDANGVVRGDVQRIGAGTRSAGNLLTLGFPRAFGAAALLANGDVIVAGGFGGSGAGVVEVERITAAFGSASVATVAGVTVPRRIGPSLLRMGSDILLFAGGTDRRTDNLGVDNSVPPASDASLLVPFGNNSFLRVAADNDMMQGRFEHQAFVAGVNRDVAIFLGGTAMAPRRSPQPHVERFLLQENRFLGFGLMGPGTALEAGVLNGSGAALVSAGGVDPHTGRTSDAVRAFDTESGTYREVTELLAPRRDHTLTRFSVTEDNTMLVAGGRDDNGVVLSSLSVLDTVNGTDRPLPVSLRTPRFNHTATRLADGNPVADGAVLLCGGQGPGGEALDNCEIVIPPSNPLDPNTFNTAAVAPVLGRLATGRFGHTATLLESGEVLIVGGGDVATAIVSADLFVPDNNAPQIVRTGQPVRARRGHAAVLLGAGHVLIVGGEVFDTVVGATRSAELYVHATRSFVAVDDMEEERAAPAAFLLGDGNAMVCGGARNNPGVPGVPTRSNQSCEIYVTNPDGTGEFNDLDVPPLSMGRSDVRFVDVLGRAIVTGGTHRDGTQFTGDERRTPLFFVDFLQEPDQAIGP